MPAPEPERCPSCQRLVVRALTEAGATMLVDAETHPEATVELTMRSGLVLARFAGWSERFPRHRPHFATCRVGRN